MSDPTRKNDVLQGIKRVVESYPTIAAASDALGINRQQLNKYLNGTSMPSLRVLRRISQVTGLPIDALYQENVQDRMLPDKSSLGSDSPAILPQTGLVRSAENLKIQQMTTLQGRYIMYQLSPLYPGFVTCELLRIMVVNRAIHAASMKLAVGEASCVEKIFARFNVSFAKGRLVLIEIGGATEEEVKSVMMFYAGPNNDPKLLTGEKLGVADIGARPIYNTRTVLKRISGSPDISRGLVSIGDLAADISSNLALDTSASASTTAH
ncbi:helix-turn-helix domain-containing protein [Szabonella alba]|uniref:Helix-turn-helix transcriptional regulator n=1 Tax=Szabonella alba TaxID=2804194 RepID=A0A8K0VBA2_9RHOB|nr:helix-turn-helix transcriptional regulator [Szabonella alba]MBL4919044.1 helix-turn-helix transcriptional regulator [Szabonella alba]